MMVGVLRSIATRCCVQSTIVAQPSVEISRWAVMNALSNALISFNVLWIQDTSQIEWSVTFPGIGASTALGGRREGKRFWGTLRAQLRTIAPLLDEKEHAKGPIPACSQ